MLIVSAAFALNDSKFWNFDLSAPSWPLEINIRDYGVWSNMLIVFFDKNAFTDKEESAGALHGEGSKGSSCWMFHGKPDEHFLYRFFSTKTQKLQLSAIVSIRQQQLGYAYDNFCRSTDQFV